MMKFQIITRATFLALLVKEKSFSPRLYYFIIPFLMIRLQIFFSIYHMFIVSYVTHLVKNIIAY